MVAPSALMGNSPRGTAFGAMLLKGWGNQYNWRTGAVNVSGPGLSGKEVSAMKKKFIVVAVIAAALGAVAKIVRGRMSNKEAEAE